MATFPGGLHACKQCGRKFVPESLSKHEPACIKAAKKKPKVFDSAKQRAEGTELTYKQIKQAQKKNQNVAPPKNNWRIKHEQFVSAIRNARGVQHAIDMGIELPPPPPPTIDPDYIQCQYCQRRFNTKAAERHIPFCKEQKSRVSNKTIPDANVKARMAARTQYSVPKPKAKGAAESPAMSSPGYGGGAGSKASPGGGGAAGRGARTGMSNELGGRQPAAARGRPSQVGYGSQPRDFESPDYDTVSCDSLPVSTGPALRTGRSSKVYQDAVRDVNSKNTSHSRIKGTPPHRHIRDGTRDISSSNSSRPSSGSLKGVSIRRETESGYHSSSSENEIHGTPLRIGSAGAKFCHECGSRYPVPNAKFCCECGVKRIVLSKYQLAT